MGYEKQATKPFKYGWLIFMVVVLIGMFAAIFGQPIINNFINPSSEPSQTPEILTATPDTSGATQAALAFTQTAFAAQQIPSATDTSEPVLASQTPTPLRPTATASQTRVVPSATLTQRPTQQPTVTPSLQPTSAPITETFDVNSNNPNGTLYTCSVTSTYHLSIVGGAYRIARSNQWGWRNTLYVYRGSTYSTTVLENNDVVPGEEGLIAIIGDGILDAVHETFPEAEQAGRDAPAKEVSCQTGEQLLFLVFDRLNDGDNNEQTTGFDDNNGIVTVRISNE